MQSVRIYKFFIYCQKLFFSGIFILLPLISNSQCLEVATHTKISDTRGYFTGSLSGNDRFGTAEYLGDLDGDGIGDLIIGARRDDDGGSNRGASYVVFLDKYGRAKSHQKISDTQGGFTGILNNGDEFCGSVGLIGDLNSDGNIEVMAGAQYDDDGGLNRGAFYILSLKPDGTVKSNIKISDTQGGFGGILSAPHSRLPFLSNLTTIPCVPTKAYPLSEVTISA